jgi:serine/threonine protein kinase
MSSAPTSTPAAARPPGSIIAGRYQVESVIGQGGMGDVYLVKHMVMRKRLALKLLKPELSTVAEFSARFEREAMAAANIDHPHVAAATDCGKTEDGTLFLALAYIDGGSLRQAMQIGPIPVQRALHIAQQVASAMVRAHELGIIHRDLKPENIMLTRREGDPDFVKVLDFGLAKLSAGPKKAGDQDATVQKLTQLGEIFGTPQYMAPEQTTGGEADGRTDLYALGVIMYEMLTGRLPFDGKDIAEFLRHQLVTPLPPMKKRAPQVTIPDWVEALVRRLCEKLPEDRYQSAEQFVDALEGAAQEHQLALTPPKARSSSPSTPGIPSSPLALSNSQPQPASAAATSGASGTPAKAGAVPQTASIVMFLNAVGRAQKRLPGPLKNVAPENLGAIVGVLGILLFGGLFLAIWLLRSPEDSSKPKRTTSSQVQEGPTDEEIQTASASGVAGLQQLAGRYPEAPEVLRPLATAYIRQGQADSALNTLGQLSRKSPQALDDPEINQFIITQVTSPREDIAGAALRVVERSFGDQAVDLLLQLAERQNPRLRARVNASLNNMRTRTDLSPATQALLELRAAPKCENKRVALTRVRQFGDARSLPFLYALQTPTGCHPFGLGDCWGCLRQSTDLEDTIKAVTSRPAAGATAPATNE